MIFHHATGDRHPTHLHKFIKRYWFELSFFLSSVTFNFSCVRFWYKHLITSSINVSITSNFSQVRFWYKKFITSNATGSTHPLIKFSVNLNFFHVRFWYQYIIISNVIHISQENVTKKKQNIHSLNATGSIVLRLQFHQQIHFLNAPGSTSFIRLWWMKSMFSTCIPFCIPSLMQTTTHLLVSHLPFQSSSSSLTFAIPYPSLNETQCSTKILPSPLFNNQIENFPFDHRNTCLACIGTKRMQKQTRAHIHFTPS